MDVVVLTALGLEFDAVHAHLADPQEHVDSDGTSYAVGVLRGGACRLALAVIGAGNVAAAALTGRAIDAFRPKALLLVGVAGGLAHDVALGDVVVATHVYAYQGGRAEPDGVRVRPRGWPLAHRLEQIARGVARTGAWAATLDAAGGARVHFKPLVSGDLVLDTRTGPVAELIAEHYGDAIAIDMESVGVAEAAHRMDFYRAVTIRGVSDRAGGEKRRTDAQGWQPRAAVRAAAFAVALAERIVRPMPAAPPGRPSETGPCPYPGLAAFREQDADLFFGRGELADELAGLVARRRFVPVVGPSGSGKSSLLHAGLIPRLRPHGWAVAELRPLPGVPAAKTLAAALLPLLREQESEASPWRAVWADMVAGGRLPELIGDVLAETGAARLLVCVDQFEELDRATAADLAGLLAQLATGVVPVHVVLTLRTETLDVAMGPLGLGELARNSVFLLTPMRPDQLRVAIEAPAEPTGVTFEAGLVDRIVAAAGDSPAALPLIQFALSRLWEEAEGPVLTHAGYGGFGGVEGALAGYAEWVWSTQLDDAERLQSRRLLLQLTRPIGADGVVRRTARASELIPDLLPVARRLAATRLVVESMDAHGEPAYDLAHAALATHWQRLRDWLTEERDFRTWQEDLRASIQRAEPLRGPRLAAARRWLHNHPDGLTRDEHAFVAASLRRDRRRTLAWRGGAALVTVLAILTSTLAVVLAKRSGELADQLRQNAAYALISQASQLAPNQPDTAALMSVAAYRASPNPAVLANLAGEYLRYRSTSFLLPSDLTYVREVRTSTDGRTVAAVGTGGGVVWRLDDKPPAPIYLGKNLKAVALSPDGRLVAGVDASGKVTLWQPDGAVVTLGTMQDVPPDDARLRFDRDGRRLLALFPGTEPMMWDVERRARVVIPGGAARQASPHGSQVWFGPDEDSLVVDGDGALTLWSMATRQGKKLTGVGDTRVTVTRDGKIAFTCANGMLDSWDLGTRPKRNRAPAPGGKCPKLSGSRTDGSGSATLVGEPTDHTGRFLLTGAPGEGGDEHRRVRATVVDLTTGAAAYPVLPPNAGIIVAYDVAATGDSIRVVSSAGSSVAVLDVPRTAFAPINRGPEPAFAAGPLFGPPHWAATTTTQPEHQLSLWNTDTGTEGVHKRISSNELPWHFTADGRRLVTSVAVSNLTIRDVPSLDVVRKLSLPNASGIQPSNFLQPYSGLCIDDTADPDTVAVVFAGYLSRLNLKTGKRVSARLWRDDADLNRLARIGACEVRPNHDEIAFSTGQSIEVWDLEQGHHITNFPLNRATKVTSVQFSADGQHLAVLAADGALDVWDMDQRRPVIESLTVLPAGLFYTSIVDFTTDDRIIVRTNGGLRIWDLTRQAAIAEIDIDSEKSEPVMSTDPGTLLVWMSPVGLMRMPLEPEHWAEHLCGIVGRDITDTERRTLPAGSPSGQICRSLRDGP